MAVVNKFTRVDVNTGGRVWSNLGGTALANGDQTQPYECQWARTDKSWQVTGTFGAAGSIQLEASDDGVTWVIVGAALTAAGLVNTQISSRFLRFNVTAGDGTTALFATLTTFAQRGS